MMQRYVGTVHKFTHILLEQRVYHGIVYDTYLERPHLPSERENAQLFAPAGSTPCCSNESDARKALNALLRQRNRKHLEKARLEKAG